MKNSSFLYDNQEGTRILSGHIDMKNSGFSAALFILTLLTWHGVSQAGSGYSVPPYLHISILPDKADPENSVILRLSHPTALHGCFIVSPLDYKVLESEQALDIKTGGYLVSAQTGPEQSGCGAAGKPVRVDIPLKISDLRDKDVQTLYLQTRGFMDIYKISVTKDSVRITAVKPPAYYRPDPQGRLSVDLAAPVLEATAH